METFIALCICFAVFLFGIAIGNQTAEKEVNQKEITEANLLCQPSEGLYKLNKSDKSATAYCKNNDKFTLSGDKK